MTKLLILSALPLLAAALAVMIRNVNVTRKLAPILCWLQLPVIVYLFLPLLFPGITSGASALPGVAAGAPSLPGIAGVPPASISTIQLCPEFTADRLSALFLLLTTFVCSCALSHADSFFDREKQISTGYEPYHERIFYSCSALFLLAMSYIFLCDNLGILWVCTEATTLASAALVYYSRTKHALEATYKYLIICSVGIAFALLGTILIFASSQYGPLPHGSLNWRELATGSAMLQYPLLRLGYIFCLVGYGTKAGIFPLHSWLPDAHSEAPAPASAMLSGSLLNCALFAIWRISQIVSSTGHELLAMSIPLVLGAVTALAASLFLVHQRGIKRLWAYSSIENVGIMLVAIALGSGGLFFLQALNHSLAKVALFLLSGNVVQATGSKQLAQIKGVLSASPAWGVLLCLAAFAVTGAPPFGAFTSEILILIRSADYGHWLVVGILIVALALSFIAVCIHVASILFGTPKNTTRNFRPVASSLVPALLVVCAIVCGITSLPSLLVTP
jgi:hydrogenase-4 component F